MSRKNMLENINIHKLGFDFFPFLGNSEVLIRAENKIITS